MNGRDRRALMLGGLVVGIAVAGLRLAPWGWRSASEARAGLVARAELLGRMRAEIVSAAALEDSGAVVRDRMAALAPTLLTGGTRSEATADLGVRLSAAARRNRVKVSRSDPVPDSADAGALRRVVLRAAIESDTGGLLALLQALAQESAVLVVGELRTAVADPHVERSQPELLHTELTVQGWYLTGAKAR